MRARSLLGTATGSGDPSPLLHMSLPELRVVVVVASGGRVQEETAALLASPLSTGW